MPILTPPHANTGTYSDGRWRRYQSDLWNYFVYPEGQAIVKRDGAWTLSPVVVPDTDTEAFHGGYRHVITEAKAAELTLAGFGQYITPDETPPEADPPGYGDGAFGSGDYGD